MLASLITFGKQLVGACERVDAGVVAVIMIRVDLRAVSACHLALVVEVDRNNSGRAGASSAAGGRGARTLENRAV